jgi:fucose 4-O-acetylase-like acetyltransferase
MIMMENAVTLSTLAGEELKNPSAPKRLDAVDIAKGILILAVVLSHAWFANSNILGDYLPFSMPAFFFLSGYTYKPGRSYLKNIRKRALGLLIPYCLFGILCNLLYPVYITLSKSYVISGAKQALWLAWLKADALNMLMGTPMWFLVALFTASIIFFAVADRVRDSLAKTAITVAVLLAAAIVIDVVKKSTLVWFIDLAPYAAAMMVIGTYCGRRQLFAKLSVKAVIIGLLCLAAAEVLNIIFPGSGQTSVVIYIVGEKWYGVLTAFAIALTGSIGTLCVAKLLENVPVLRSIFKWLGRNSIWILCIHYCAIMLIELQLYNMKILSNSIMQIVAATIYGYGHVTDKATDIIVKILVAAASIGISAVYALIHNAVKGKVKKAIANRKA